MGTTKQCLELVSEIQTKSDESIFHPDVRRLRQELRSACYDAFRTDFQYAHVSV